MANQFDWDKPNITANDITRVLVQQYGSEQPTRIKMEDTSKPISYKSALVACECLRCGRNFMMTPFALVNSIYLNGYVCTNCGMLSDDELRENIREEMRVQTLDFIKKEKGRDLVSEAMDEQNEESAESIDANSEMNNIDYDDMSETIDEEIEEQVEDIESTKENTEIDETDSSKYMASDEDYAVTAEDIVSESDISENNEEDLSEDQVNEILDTVGPAIFGSDGEVSDEDAKEINSDNSEIVEETGSKNYDTDEIDISENNEEDLSEDQVNEEESSENIVAEVSDEDVFGVEEPSEEKESDTSGFIWVGKDAYTEEELVNALRKSVSVIKEKLGCVPFDLDDCSVTDEGLIEIKCKDCGYKVNFKSFKEMENIQNLYEFEYPISNRSNGSKDDTPMITTCSVCRKYIIEHGYNKYFMNKVSRIISPHGHLVNEDTYRFINDKNVGFKVECNGVVKELQYKDLFEIFGKGKDPTKNPIFERPRQDKTKIVLKDKDELVEEKVHVFTRDIEQSKPVISTESTTPKENIGKFTFAKSEHSVKQESTTSDSNNGKAKEPIFEYAKNEPPKENTFKYSGFKNEKREDDKKPMFEFSKEHANTQNYSNVFVNDSLKDFEEERLYSEEQLNKNKVFSENPSMKIAKKNIARLTGKINPFERETSLKTEFNETCFASFIEDLSEKTGVPYKLIIDERSYEIPVVDFASGLRIICSNLEEADLANARYEWIKPRVPFSYYEDYAEDVGNGVLKKKRKEYIWCVLFSDSVEYARDATFAALVKYINPEILAYNGKKIVIQDNLMYQYTKNKQYLRDFDKRYSVFPSQKPSTGALGIVVRWETSNKATAKDVLKLKLQMEGRNNNVNNLDTLANDYDEYMVASIKYIEHFSKESNRVIYTITEYVEVGSSIIGDGLAQCLRALLKEYMIKYPQLRGMPPYIIMELDPNIYPSPSIRSYIDKGTLCKMNDTFKNIIEGVHPQKKISYKAMKYSYVRRPEYRNSSSDIDHMRRDIRMFSAGTIIHTMAEEIKQAGVANTIRNEEVKNAFIANMGFIESTQAEIKMYFVNQSMLFSLMSDGATYNLIEHIDNDMVNSSKMVSDSNMGYGVNNVYANPGAMNKYMNIMNNGSPEARDYLNRLMMEDYKQKMMDYQMNMSNVQSNGTVFGSQNNMQNQQFNQFGMNPMMNNPYGNMNMGFGIGMGNMYGC